jgi:ferredoxin
MSSSDERTLVLNPILCDGRGLCQEAAPDLIELDEWGYPLMRGGGLRIRLSRDDEQQARAAVQSCPKLALHIER